MLRPTHCRARPCVTTLLNNEDGWEEWGCASVIQLHCTLMQIHVVWAYIENSCKGEECRKNVDESCAMLTFALIHIACLVFRKLQLEIVGSERRNISLTISCERMGGK